MTEIEKKINLNPSFRRSIESTYRFRCAFVNNKWFVELQLVAIYGWCHIFRQPLWPKRSDRCEKSLMAIVRCVDNSKIGQSNKETWIIYWLIHFVFSAVDLLMTTIRCECDGVAWLYATNMVRTYVCLFKLEQFLNGNLFYVVANTREKNYKLQNDSHKRIYANDKQPIWHSRHQLLKYCTMQTHTRTASTVKNNGVRCNIHEKNR